jgi:dephospho-CoA kinase
MLKVGLTGGIASGKSSVGRMFVELGCRLIDSDLITRELFAPGQSVNKAVAAEFGLRVIAADGSINRGVLAELVFNDRSLREKLNAIVHPAIRNRQEEFLQTVARENPHAIGIVEAALIIEAGNYVHYDKVILVGCTPEVQRRRLRERSALTEEQIEARIASQMPMEKKLPYADYVIDNSGELSDTREQVQGIYEQLVLAERGLQC